MKQQLIKLDQDLDYYILKATPIVADVIHLAKRRTKRQFRNRLMNRIRRHNDELQERQRKHNR